MDNKTIDTLAIQSKLASYLSNPGNSNEHLPTYNDLDSQVDSGHPSLDQNNSPSNETAETMYNIDNEDESGVGGVGGSDGTAASEPNQLNEDNSNSFVVYSAARPPNKVILEPLDPKLTNNVPKHLFAAKKFSR